MQTTSPGQTTIITESGIPTGESVGFQVFKAASDTPVSARQTLGVSERPAGSGNYVITFIAPAEGDLYLVVLDWNGGILTPETSKVIDLRVTSAVELGSSGLGEVADYAKMYLGGETWSGLVNSADYGPSYVSRAIDTIKRRTMATPPDTAGEASLDPIVASYLGLLSALQLISAARDYWGSQQITITRGDDSSEMVTYANRMAMMKELREDLMRQLPAATAAAQPIIDQPLVIASSGPAIDEDDDFRVTDDPRDFPSRDAFPGTLLPLDSTIRRGW